MKTDLEVEVEVYLGQFGKVLIFRDKQTNRTFPLYIDHYHHSDHFIPDALGVFGGGTGSYK